METLSRVLRQLELKLLLLAFCSCTVLLILVNFFCCLDYRVCSISVSCFLGFSGSLKFYYRYFKCCLCIWSTNHFPGLSCLQGSNTYQPVRLWGSLRPSLRLYCPHVPSCGRSLLTVTFPSCSSPGPSAHSLLFFFLKVVLQYKCGVFPWPKGLSSLVLSFSSPRRKRATEWEGV